MQDILIATGNPGKVREIRKLLQDIPVHALSSADGFEPPDVEEDQPTLEGNASKKARAWFDAHGLPALADDTGLEVDALDGRPGVRSARFAGSEATDADNRHHLLSALGGESNRSAQFRTIITLVHGEGTISAEGSCRGTITREERGNQGFGYDSIFVPEGYEQTFAELPSETKNQISHRRNALDAFLSKLIPFLQHGSSGSAR